MYDEGYEQVSVTDQVEIVPGRLCEEDKEEEGPQATISVGSRMQQVTAGEAGATYSLAITNEGSNAATYTVNVQGVDNWGTYRVDPSSTVVVDPEETKPVFIFVSANEDTSAGQQSFMATISSQDVSESVQLTATVNEQSSGVRQWAEFVLIALVVLLVVLGLIIGFTRMRDNRREGEEGEDLSGQTYYQV